MRDKVELCHYMYLSFIMNLPMVLVAAVMLEKISFTDPFDPIIGALGWQEDSWVVRHSSRFFSPQTTTNMWLVNSSCCAVSAADSTSFENSYEHADTLVEPPESGTDECMHESIHECMTQ